MISPSSTTMTVPTDEVASNHIDILPDELLISIFEYLPLDTILECENVCSRWKKLSRDATLWRRIVVVYSKKPGESEVNNTNLEIIANHSECIRCLKIQYVYNYSVIRSTIEQCPNITSIELVMCLISKEFEDCIVKWPNLRKINLKNSQMSMDGEEFLVQYDYFKFLTYLDVADCGLPAVARDSLLRCNSLSHIIIKKVKDLNLEYVKKLIKSKMAILRALHIYGDDAIDDECLFMLSQCHLLEDLAIIRCEYLTDAGLIKLADLKQMEHLLIWKNDLFTETNLHRFLSSPNLVKLETLCLSEIENISPLTADMICENYKNLKFLSLHQCPKISDENYQQQLRSKLGNIRVVLYRR